MSNRITKGPEAASGRDAAIDMIKGIAIVLVIYSHTWPFCQNFIHLFNLPIFMVTSGYCFKNRIRSWADWRRYMRGKLRTLYVPCALCNGVFALFSPVFLRLGLYTDDPAFLAMTADWPVPQKLHVIRGAGDVLQKLLRVVLLTDTTQMGTATWFLIVLFAICAFHGAVCRLTAKLGTEKKRAGLAGLFLLTAMLAQFSDRLFNGTSYPKCAFYCYLAYLLGIALRKLDLKRLEHPLCACLSFALLAFLSRFYYMDLATGAVAGVLPFAAGVLAGWFLLKPLVVRIAAGGRLGRILCYLGRHTMPVICLHILCFKPVTWLYIRTYRLPKIYLASFHSDFDAPEPWKLLYLAAGVALPLLLASLWRRLAGMLR